MIFRHLEQYHRHRGSLISAVLTGGLWHFWWYFEWHSWHSTRRLSFSSVRTLKKTQKPHRRKSETIVLDYLNKHTCIYCKQVLIQLQIHPYLLMMKDCFEILMVWIWYLHCYHRHRHWYLHLSHWWKVSLLKKIFSSGQFLRRHLFCW